MIKNDYQVSILSTGSYLPKTIITNSELSKTLDTTDDWIRSRTGILQRHIASEDETVSFMAAEAAKIAIAHCKPEEIDLIIVVTVTAEKFFPSVAAVIQAKLGCVNALAFDIREACSGFISAILVAINMIKSGGFNKTLLVCSEKMSRILNWKERSTCVLFGDGAGAMVLEKTQHNGFMDVMLKTDGNFSEVLFAESNCGITMNGRAVFATAVEKLTQIINLICEKNNIKLTDIDHFIFHQSNARMIEYLIEKLHLDKNKVPITIDKHANTSAASIPLLLDCYKKNFKKNEKILFAAVGAGFSWGAALLHW